MPAPAAAALLQYVASCPQVRRARPVRVVVGGLVLVLLAGTVLMAGFMLQLAGPGSNGQASAGCAGSTVVAPGTPEGQRGISLDDEQRAHASTIVEVGHQLAVPPRGHVIAIATALQESLLRNLTYGDRDSLGLFQQRPSQGWGSRDQILDSRYASEQFYRRLLGVPGWERMPVMVAAQAVQRSGFPTAYAKWEQLADTLVDGSTATAYPCAPVLPGDCPATGLGVELGLTPDALRVARCVVAQYGIRDLGGLATSGHIEGSDHYTGRAVDVMIGGWAVPNGNQLGWQVAEWARVNAAALGVTNIIWDARTWSTDRAAEGWRPYTHQWGNSNPTLAHLDHVHVSVEGNAGSGFGSTSPTARPS